MEKQEHRSTTRRDRMRRTLAVNAYWGIDSESHCHEDVTTNNIVDTAEPLDNKEGYIVSMDIETGGITVKSVSAE